MALLALGAAACGDPLFIAGDAPGLMRIVAGRPDAPGSALDSLAVESRLRRPAGLAVGPDGVVYIADAGNGRVLGVGSSGAVRTVASAGGGDPLVEPVAIEYSGDVLRVADPGAHRIWRVELPDGPVEPLAGTGERGAAADGTAADQAALDEPYGLAVAADGRVFFSERGAHRVRVIRGDGTLGTIAGSGDRGFAGDGGPADAARFDLPSGLSLSGGVLYVADFGNDRVRAIDLGDGTIRTVAGSGLRGFGGDGGPAAAAALDRPADVSAATDGRLLLIADFGNHRVRQVELQSGVISTLAGTGATEFNGDLGDAGRTALNGPEGVAASALEFLFIADTGHHIAWRVPIRF